MALASDELTPPGEPPHPPEGGGDARPGGFVAGALIGGPLGRHARRSARWTALSLLTLVTIVTCLVGYGQKFPCRDVNNWKHNYQYTRVCYSDIVPLYSAEKLSDGKAPYLDQQVEYPVLIGAAMQAGAKVAQAVPANNFIGRNALFFDATAVLLSIAAIITVLCTALTAGLRRMDVMILAAAPLLAFHAFTNWDLLAVAFTAGGLLAWSKKAPAVAGLLFGFGAATKAYPLLMLVALGLLAFRAGALRAWWRCVACAVAALAATYAVVWPLAGSYVGDDGRRHNDLWRFIELNNKRPADWDSIPYLVQYVSRSVTSARLALVAIVIGLLVVAVVAFWRRTPRALTWAAGLVILAIIAVTQAVGYARDHGGAIPAGTLNTAGIVGALVLWAGVGYVVLTAPRRPRVPQIAFLVVASFLLVNKVDSPQYSLWLLPLAVLAYPRWRPLLVWQLIEIFEVVMRYLWFIYDGAAGKAGVTEGWFVSAVVARELALVWLAALVIREIYHPAQDVVRELGVDDPAGGVLDGAPDRWAFT